ncbi:MAG: chain-length determining protein, partial [Sphingomonas sp.]|nr:chain-length determining protein [Sphingomonas sp.]
MNGLYDEVLLAIHGIWNRRWLALAVAWAICIIGWFAVAQIPNSYVSTARVSIELNSLLPDKVGISTADQQKAIERVRQTLTSTTNLATVVRTTDLSSTVANDRDIADRVATLQQSIRITAQPNDLFEISATASSPKLARQIVQKLIDLFVAENLNGDRTENSETLKFLDTQLAQRQKALQDSEARRADFQNRYLGSLP